MSWLIDTMTGGREYQGHAVIDGTVTTCECGGTVIDYGAGKIVERTGSWEELHECPPTT